MKSRQRQVQFDVRRRSFCSRLETCETGSDTKRMTTRRS
jgi:hypothetical protein